jgi:4-amino-4-deoxy-L-arabinose transferase-like glycosyltransferase
VRRARRIPQPLTLLLVVAAVNALAWIVAMPALQGPDEGRHVAYVQRLADAHELPFGKDRASYPADAGEASSELALAGTWAGLEPLRGNPAARPFWTAADEDLYARAKTRLPADASTDGGYASSFRNPPLYYLYAALPYSATSSGDILTRTFWMRVLNVPLLLIAVAAAWLLAAELLGGTLAPALTATVVALQPQMANVTATVNPDIALVAAWTVGLLAMVRLVRRGLSAGRLVGLGAVIAVAVLIQPRGAPMIVPAAVAVLLASRRFSGRTAGVLVAVTALAGALGAAVVVERGAGNLRQFASYLWQFYLPKLSFMEPRIGPEYGARDVFGDRLWGAFAQLEVAPADWLLTLLAWATLALAVAAVIVLVVRRRDAAAHWRELAVLAIAPLVSLAVLHVVAYRAMLTEPDDPIIAGRYLLPFAAIAGLALAGVLRALPPRAGAAAAGMASGALGLLALSSLGLVVERFYG